MFPVSPNTYNVTVATATSVNEDETIAVSFIFQGSTTSKNFPAGSTVKPGDLLVTNEGTSQMYLVSSTQITLS